MDATCCFYIYIDKFYNRSLFRCFFGTKRGRAVDISISFVSSIIQAIPPFVLAVLILFIGAIKLRIIPLGGAYPVDMEPSFSIDFIISVIKHALGPIVAISIPQIAVWILAMREIHHK
ncbi:ABC transporter permease subunit [Caloramator sp. Dgby_cultured_2]|uniref:ABC transporter permease subunit n=1 Tax=Caloramator sp. Dgby_cultured_2 TaxID=3029174 RepID=UPI00237DBD9B|nr:ABC transporter permease subunit [Caloramator sp. Dgby_cultured_2]WDU82437.1 ABC transporter permease subunit [Caloramator sp. Dgby_cultured_2]